MTSEPAIAGNESRETKIVLLFCLLAAVHVFIFSAAFPFFNNVDEPMHFDLALKYSHGHVPRRLETISPDSAVYLALFSSCAYLGTADNFPGGQFPPPPWTESPDKMARDVAADSAGWQKVPNYEVSQTPLYYVMAGSWWRVGQWLGFHDGRLLYWLRFLNIALVAALVALSYVAARIVFPENIFLRLGVPAVLALMPQTAFYSIGNDILSPLCFGVLFICLLKWLEAGRPSLALGAVTGIAFAATYLSKTTNAPLLAVAVAVLLFKMWQRFRRGEFQKALPAAVEFSCFAVPPILGWAIWCRHNFGDFTGSKLKMEFFGWTVKPFGQWWHHPIFTPWGLWTYFSGQMGTFWQGEFCWHNQPMSLPGTEAIYSILTLVLLAAALPALFPADPGVSPSQRQALQVSLAVFLAGLAFFAVMSVIYDFHDCPNPSREHPYFRAGRMFLGALILFLLLIVYGLDRLLSRFKNTTKFFVLGTMISAMLVLEIVTDWPAFFNNYNWFHLP